MLQKVIYVILGISIAIVFMPQGVREYHGSQQAAVLGVSTKGAISISSSPELASNLPVPTLTARSVYAFDLSSGTILFTKNFDDQLPIASLTKLMTALVVMKYANSENVAEVKAADVNVIGSNMGLVPREKISIINLLRGLLISSSNDSAQVLASAVAGTHQDFVNRMNEEAISLGLNSTRFNNPVGLDSAENYSTAKDLSILVSEFLTYDMLSEIVKTADLEVASVDGRHKHRLRTTNKLLLEDPSVSGIKTGFTSQAKGNLIIRSGNAGQEVITIVLGSDNREDDSRKLLDWIFQVYRW